MINRALPIVLGAVLVWYILQGIAIIFLGHGVIDEIIRLNTADDPGIRFVTTLLEAIGAVASLPAIFLWGDYVINGDS